MPVQNNQDVEESTQQLQRLKQERDELNNQARTWVEKRNSLHQEIKTLQAEAKNLREKRDEINLQVQILKAAREKAKTQAKQKREEIAKLREKVRTLAPKKPKVRQADLEREIENLEWKIQTSSLPVKEEKALVDRVQDLETQGVVYKQMDQLNDKLLQLQTETMALQNEAKLKHQQLTTLADQSQQLHTKLTEVFDKIKNLRQSADEAHQKYLEHRQKADETHQRVVELQQKTRTMKQEREQKEKQQYELRGLALKEEAAKKAKEKMNRGEKLTWQEFQLLTEQDETDAEATEH
jgi:uncharacterized coiled-coil DUF342 family protein